MITEVSIAVLQGKFSLGELVATPQVLDRVSHAEIYSALRRHIAGDWGTLDENDINANNSALERGERLLSAYVSDSGVKFWIITEADRSSTTVLLPEDY